MWSKNLEVHKSAANRLLDSTSSKIHVVGVGHWLTTIYIKAAILESIVKKFPL